MAGPWRDEHEALDAFAVRYAIPTTDVVASVEQQVIGAVWGANGYTTLAQADELARRIGARPDLRVLDVGTGRGWPGVYYAARYGCTVVGTDLPVGGLVAASERARAEGVGGRFAALAASGRAQPFRDASFDAVVHTDVLCCLRPKRAVLRSLRRVLRPGGRTAFTVIHVAPGLDAGQRLRARRRGPRAVATRSTYAELLRNAGFTDVEAVDITGAFVETARAWIDLREEHASELAPLEPPGSFAQRQRDHRGQLAAAEDGLLRRTLFSATAGARVRDLG